MFFPYLEFPDNTQTVFSEIKPDGTVILHIERPREGGFDTAECSLPSYQWLLVDGFSDKDMERWDAFAKNNAPFIFELARQEELAHA